MEEEKTEKERYHATLSSCDGDWLVCYYDGGHRVDYDAYTFRWYARWKAHLRLRQLRRGTEIIR